MLSEIPFCWNLDNSECNYLPEYQSARVTGASVARDVDEALLIKFLYGDILNISKYCIENIYFQISGSRYLVFGNNWRS